MTPKARRMLNHSKQRAIQRFGLSLSSKNIKYLSTLIRNNQAEFVERTSNDRTLWRVRFQNTIMIAVYSKRHKGIVTLLPDEYVSSLPTNEQ